MKYLYTLMIVLCISLLVGIELSEDEQQWLAQHPIIRIAPDPYFPPIEWFDDQGRYQGIARDYMDVIASELGIDFDIVQCNTWEEVLEKAKNREIDMLPAAAQTPQREEYMDLSSPYLVFPGVIISRKDAEVFTSLEALYGKEVTIVAGYIWQDMICLQHPEIVVKTVPSLKEGLRNVSMGDDDVIIGTLPIALYYIQQEGITNLHITGESGYDTKLAILTRSDWPLLGSIMQKALEAIPPETKQRILKKWISAEKILFYQTKLFRIITSSILAGCLFALILILSWNRILKKRVKQRTLELERDIASRLETEQSLRESEEKYRLLFEHSLDLIALHKPDGSYIYLSPSVTTLLGYRVQELVGTDPYLLFHPDDMVKVREFSHEKALKGEIVHTNEYRIKRKDGQYVWFSTNTNPILNEAGEVIRLQTISRDISQKKQIDEQLRQNQQEIEQQLARSEKQKKANLIIMKDLNHTTKKLKLEITEHQKTEEELKRLKDNLEELVAQRTAELAEKTQKLTLSQDALGLLLEDINQSRAQLHESNILLRNSNRELEEFAYSISHDLRAPLRSIIGFSEIISRRYKSDLNDEGQKYLHNILMAGKNMAALIEDLLLYSRLGMKSKKPVDLQDVFTKIVFNLNGLIEETAAEVTIPQNLPTIQSSETLLYQIFLNLIQNGICYHQSGAKVQIAVKAELTDTTIILTVKDNGIGIEERYQEKIFTLFQRLHSQSAYPGTGIGLAIVKKSVTALGGKIRLESKVGEGSAFYIELPVDEGGN